eukprot:scaffold3259_cov373-Prasinococcus_capsulatus_cf.AAC.5
MSSVSLQPSGYIIPTVSPSPGALTPLRRTARFSPASNPTKQASARAHTQPLPQAGRARVKANVPPRAAARAAEPTAPSARAHTTSRKHSDEDVCICVQEEGRKAGGEKRA